MRRNRQRFGAQNEHRFEQARRHLESAQWSLKFVSDPTIDEHNREIHFECAKNSIKAAESWLHKATEVFDAAKEGEGNA